MDYSSTMDYYSEMDCSLEEDSSFTEDSSFLTELSDPEPKHFADEYQVIRSLAEDKTKSLWLAKRISDGTLHVAKLLADCESLRKTWCEDRSEMVPDEVVLSELLDHPNIIDLHELFYTGCYYVVVMEYLPEYVTLTDYVAQNGAMSVVDAREILTQLLDTCLYLLSRKVDHRDIKSCNILYNPATRRIKLIDFGSASQLPDTPYTTRQGTEMNLPPEYFATGSYSSLPAMTWSFGTLAYFLLNGAHPFSTAEQIAEYKDLKFLNPALDAESKEFLTDVLAAEEKDRIPPRELTLHPWLDWMFMD